MPTCSPAEDPRQRIGPCPAGDDDRASRPRHLAGGGQLAPHAAGAQRALARAGQGQNLVVNLGDQGNQLGAVPGCGIGLVEAVDDAEDDQQRRLEQVGDHGGQAVVVADLDLVDADGVVLVDDRHGVVFEQGGQRVPHVQVAGPAVEVLVGEQKLGGVAAVAAEALVVGPDQVRLADGGGGLELRQVVGPALQPELADPRADGTRADQGHLAARVHHRADLLGQVVDSRRVEPAIGAGQDVGADLDDPDSRRRARPRREPGRGRPVAAWEVCAVRGGFSGLRLDGRRSVSLFKIPTSADSSRLPRNASRALKRRQQTL